MQTISSDADGADQANPNSWHKLDVDMDNLLSFVGSSSWDGLADVTTYGQFETVASDCDGVSTGQIPS